MVIQWQGSSKKEKVFSITGELNLSFSKKMINREPDNSKSSDENNDEDDRNNANAMTNEAVVSVVLHIMNIILFSH